jgi:hypothetical protein
MDDQEDVFEDPEVGVTLPDLNQEVDDEFALPQDEDEQLGNLPLTGSGGTRDHKDVCNHMCLLHPMHRMLLQ